MRLIRLFFCAFVLSAALLLSACEETVDPILDSDRQFTLWGTLDMNQDTQFVRVVPIRETLNPEDPNAPLNVTVTSTDLSSGDIRVWRDSTVQFRDGRIGHVFFAPLRPQPGHTYRLELSSSELPLVTSAETTLPVLPEVIVLPETASSVTTPGGSEIRAAQQVRWVGVDDRPFQIEQWYRFMDVANGQRFLDVRLPYAIASGPAESQANTWETRLNLASDKLFLADSLDLTNLLLAGLGQTITILDEAFVPPGGVFDPEILAQPGTLSNVENGFGFIGSVGRFSVEWTIRDQSARILRYNIPADFGKATPYVEPEVRVSARPWTP